MDDELLLQLLDQMRESMEMPEGTPVVITDELEEAVADYEAALFEALSKWVAETRNWPPEVAEDFTAELFDEGDAPYNVFLTLSGEGAGIWDGRWDGYFSEQEIHRLQPYLTRELSRFVDETGGGRINEALMGGVAEPPPPYPGGGGPAGEDSNGYDAAEAWRLTAERYRSNAHESRRRADERVLLERELIRATTPRERREIRMLLEDLDREEEQARHYASVPNVSRRRRMRGAPPREHLPGGYAAGMGDEYFDPEQLEIGIRVEMEHIDPAHPEAQEIAAEIARDHLREHPRYYDVLLRSGL